MDPIILDDDCVDDENENKSDFVALSGNILSNINYKLGIFIFIIGIFLYSDLFVDSILNSFPGAVDSNYPTSYGTIVQLTIYTLILIVLDLLIKYEII